MTMPPAASALRTMPQPRAPSASGCAVATTGPRTVQAPAWMALMRPKARTITHSHVREVNSAHPPRRSANIEPVRPEGRGSRIREKQTMARTNVKASTARAHPGPGPTTSAPATTGPPIMAKLRTNDINAVACCRCSRETSWGTSPCIAGMVNAIAAPLMPSSTSRRGIEAAPVRNSVATIRLGHGGERVCRLDDQGARQPVRQYASDEQKADLADAEDGDDQLQVLGGTDVKHGEGQRDCGHRRPDRRHRPSDEEPAESSVVQHFDGMAHSHGPALPHLLAPSPTANIRHAQRRAPCCVWRPWRTPAQGFRWPHENLPLQPCGGEGGRLAASVRSCS